MVQPCYLQVYSTNNKVHYLNGSLISREQAENVKYRLENEGNIFIDNCGIKRYILEGGVVEQNCSIDDTSDNTWIFKLYASRIEKVMELARKLGLPLPSPIKPNDLENLAKRFEIINSLESISQE
ncbi:MAG: hypothetical protein ABH804_00220 [archaeon]